MIDANSTIQSLSTVTATFHSAGYNTNTGSPVRGYQYRFTMTGSVATTGTAATTFTPSISVSSDNTNWFVRHQGSPVTLGTTAVTSDTTIDGDDPVGMPYVRADMTLAGPGTGPSMAFQCNIEVLG